MGSPSYTFPLKTATGKGYLVDQDGTPFLICGDAGWEAGTTLPATGSNSFATYLSDRLARGFNAFLFEFIDNEFNFGNTVAGSTWGPNVNGDLPFTTKQGGGAYNNAQTQSPLFSAPNSAYWNYLDNFLAAMQTANALVLAYPFWLGNPPNDPSSEGFINALAATSSADRHGYGAFVGARYASYKNLIWVMGGDWSLSSAQSAIAKDVVTGILSASPSSTIFSYDGTDGDSPLTVTEGWTPPGSFVDLGTNNVYTDVLLSHPYTYVQCKAEYQRTDFPGVPFFQKEGAYEFGQAGWTEQLVRAQTWQTLLGGGYGYCLGVNGLWQFASGWPSLLSSVASQAMQVVNTFFQPRDWYNLVPDWTSSFVTSGIGSGATYVSSARTNSGAGGKATWGAVYFQSNVAVTVDMSGFAPANMTLTWLDPTSGATRPYQAKPVKSTGSLSVAGTPGTNAGGDADWVLVFVPSTIDPIAFGTPF